MSSEWGNRIHLKISGSSHGDKIRAELSGLPADFKIDEEALKKFMRRRVPGTSPLVTGRKETDEPVFVSGIDNYILTGDTLTADFFNRNAESSEYSRNGIVRPGHADYTAYIKSGGKEDMRGGGRFSGRMTVAICFAGAVCMQLLQRKGMDICAHLCSVGGICDDMFNPSDNSGKQFAKVRAQDFPSVNALRGVEMKKLLSEIKEAGDSVGGVVECMVTGLPAGVGDALFDGLEGKIAEIVFAIPGVKGIEFGSGFEGCRSRGSQNNDSFRIEDGRVMTMTNNCGGILGGISDGMPLIFRAGFKPTPSIAMRQNTVDLQTMTNTEICVKGRHDPCIALRAVPVVEAAAALALTDALKENV